jgi:uncharacterized protein (DUF1330 family)
LDALCQSAICATSTHDGQSSFQVKSYRPALIATAGKATKVRDDSLRSNHKLVGTLHVQAKPATFVVIDIAGVTDAEGFKALPASSGASPVLLTTLGGRYVIRSETMTAIDGTPPKRFVVVAFDSQEKAQGWVDAQDVKTTNAIRTKTTNSRAFIVEGTANWT